MIPAAPVAPAHTPTLLSAVIESLPTALVMVDPHGHIALVNAQAEHLFGFARVALLGQPVEMLVPQRFRGQPMGAGRDFYGLRNDGSEFPLEVRASPLKTDAGTYLLNTLVDISQHQHLEKPFQLLIDAVVEYAIIMLDPGGHVVSWNQGAQRIKGYAAEEIIGHHFACFYLPEAVADGVPQRMLARAQTHGRVQEESWRVRKDGSRFWADVVITALKDNTGHLEGYLKITRDLTDRMRQEQRLRATVESAPIAMVMVNPSGRTVLANKEAERVFGYTSTELLNNPLEMLVPSRFRAGHASLRSGFFSTPKARPMRAGRDLYGMRKDGSEFPVEIGLNPVATDEGTCVLAVIVDISERKRLESAQQQLNDALLKSNLELQQFAYIASHDLQAPLRGITGITQLLSKHYAGQLDAEAELLFKHITEGVTRMQTLIDDLLTYARVESRSRPFEACRLNEIFDDVVNLLEASIHDSHAEVTHDDLPVVAGDKPQLVQLLQNLLGNAIKYHTDRPPRVHVAALRSHDQWDISVRDNGIGIHSKHYERIFEIFRRLHTTQAYPGTGIGLAVCRRIVTRHGGRLWVESEPGVGSTFHFTIKAAKQEKK